MDALSLVLEGIQSDPARFDALAQPLMRLADAFEAIAAGQMPAFSWRTLIAGRASEPRELRRFILVQPVLDYSALQPGERASAAIRQVARELGIDADPRVRIRLTGPVPLADEEFGTLAENAALNVTLTMTAVIVLLWLALRSVRVIVAILASLAVGFLVTPPFRLLGFGTFKPISVAFALLFFGLCVDFGLPFFVCFPAT